MNLVGYDAAYNAVMIVTVYSIYPEGSRTWRMMLKAANEFLPWWNKPDGPALTVIHDGEKAASSAIKEHTLPNVHSFMDCRHMANNLLANVPRKGRSYRYRRSTIAGMQNCEGQGCTDSNRSLFLCTPVAPHTLHPGGGRGGGPPPPPPPPPYPQNTHLPLFERTINRQGAVLQGTSRIFYTRM